MELRYTTRKGKIGLIFFLLIFISVMPCPAFSAESAAQAFQNAQKKYLDLSRDAKMRKSRPNWIDTIEAFASVAEKYPNTKFAQRALYMKGKIYIELYGYSQNKADVNKAVDIFSGLVKKYPDSNLADDAVYKTARIYDTIFNDKKKAYDLYRQVITKYPKGDMVQGAREGVNSIHIEEDVKEKKPSKTPITKEMVLVKEIRQWADKDYTRVVIDLDGDVSFDTIMLPSTIDPEKGTRLIIDLNNAKLVPQFPAKIDVTDGNLVSIRTAQNQKDKVRVVLDLPKKTDYNAFPLANPSRIVIDLNTKEETKDVAQTSTSTSFKKVKKWSKSSMPDDLPSIARQLSLKVSRIVIDPGHGGKAPGAIGPNGEKEKDVVLTISKGLAESLRKQGFEVFLTREEDVFLSLEERTAFANSKKADLFISIHANANRDKAAAGIETYFLNLTTDEKAIEVAARENATTSKSIGDLQLIINDLMLNSKINESSTFANCVQGSIVNALNNKDHSSKDLGVKQAPFYVLLGARMPSILVETGFMTNPDECGLLHDQVYQTSIIDGILKGIQGYISQISYAYNGEGS
jgi:N-acetylmuramoyl-L-alanine amidase